MKYLTSALLTIAFTFTVFAQSETEAQLEELYYQDQYDKIISKYAGKKDELSALSLYYVGRAYFMKDKEDKCIAFMNLSIAKDPTDPVVYYIKGYALNYKNRYTDAVECFNKSISLDPNNYRFYTGLGDSYYYQNKYAESLAAYQKAILLPECSHRAFFITGIIYLEQKEADKALQSFLAAKEKALNDMDAYADILFNLAETWIIKNDYTQAEATYNELLSVKPDDYHAYAKLMQVYYHRNEYSRAAPLRQKLYDAYAGGLLHDSTVEEMFCYDRFTWATYDIMAFERYDSGPRRVSYDKHLFYVIPAGKEKAIFTVATEYVPGSAEDGKAQYELCGYKGSLHFKSGEIFTDDSDYETLKAAAIKMMESHLD